MVLNRSGIILMLGLAVAGAAAGGCEAILGKELNPKYCAAHPDDADCMREMPMGCTTNGQCEAPAGVCLVEERTCVECTGEDAAACVGETPVCGGEHACRGCKTHGECASGACLPDGACGSDANVAYVSPMGTDNGECTKAMPCTKVAKALGTQRGYVKLAGVTDEGVTVDSRSVVFLAEPGVQLTRTSNGLLLEVKGSSRVEIYDLEITGASGATGIGISLPAGNTASLKLERAKVTNNQGGGISATGGTVTVTQSTISGNQGGGISVTNGIFDITNNFIYRNGNSTGTTTGGVALVVSNAGGNRFEFNTVVDNEISASTTSSGGLVCDIVGFSALNNIIARNYVNRVATAANANTIGQCAHLTSKVVSDLAELKFEAPDAPPFNYHLMAGSSAIDQATTPSPIAVDADGDLRPQDAQKDLGADEYKP